MMTVPAGSSGSAGRLRFGSEWACAAVARRRAPLGSPIGEGAGHPPPRHSADTRGISLPARGTDASRRMKSGWTAAR